MKEVIEIQEALSAKFSPEDIEYRIGRSGIKNGNPWATCLVYVTNRAIQERLDSVMGIDCWRNEFREWMDTSVMCGISLKFGKNWITKYDAASQTSIESTKGGVSNSMKRAAVEWGIGRYLYKFDEEFAICFSDGKGKYKARFENKQSNERVWGSWNPPKFPSWAMPDGIREKFYDLLASGDSWGYYIFVRSHDEDLLSKLIGTFPVGEKTYMKQQCRDLDAEGSKSFIAMTNALKLQIEENDDTGMLEIIDELDKPAKKILMGRLTDEEIESLKTAREGVEE